MFDGAMAVAADQHHVDVARGAAADSAAFHAAPTEARTPTDQAKPVGRDLLVIDSRVKDRDELAANLPTGVSLLVVNNDQDGLAAISQALATMGKVDSIQILSHGASGQFTLGSRTISSDNVDQLAGTLSSWRGSLNAGADIELYGCNVGAGHSGEVLVRELARWTGADVAASNDNTGSAAAGGDWDLEVREGSIDHSLALDARAVDNYAGLLADASPTVTLSSGGSDVLLGGQFTFTASFTNPSSQIGYAPYIDLFLPTNGRDGHGNTDTKDGVSFVSATYLGQAIKSYVLTFDASGNATHPVAKDASGVPLVIHAADYGLAPGDQFVVLRLPFSNMTQDQPSIDIAVTMQLSNLADTDFSDGTPDLTIAARGGFELGNDSADNPTSDPSLVEAGTHAFIVHPTVVSLSQTINVPEGKTVSGPNYERSFTVTTSAAAGQDLSNIVVTQPIPGDILVTSITPQGGGTLTSITLHDGSVLTDTADIDAAFARGAYLASYTVSYATLTGSADTVVDFYVPEVDADGNAIISPTSGASTNITIGAATATGEWTPLDVRDRPLDGSDVMLSGTGEDGNFEVESMALYKQFTLQTDIGSPGLSPGDTLAYSLEIALSDYFAFGENVLGNGQFAITDALGDGQDLSGTPTMTFEVDGNSYTIPIAVVATRDVTGPTSIVFDIAQSLRDAGRTVGALPGDLALDDVLQGATRLQITYFATIAQAYQQTYRQSEINEGDYLGNDATISASVLQDYINLTGGVVSDHYATGDTIPTNDVGISVVSVNGGGPSVDVKPGDIVTFQLSYDLVTGDYEQFQLSSYLPLPLFDVSGITWSEGNGVGQWHLGSGNTNGDTSFTVTSGAGNSIIFNFGDYATNATTGSRIEVQFSIRVGDQAFVDQRSLAVLGQSDQLTTIDQTHLISSNAAVIQSVDEPVLGITHGVVSTTHGTVTGTIGSWAAPGTGGVPFTGIINDLAAIDGNVDGIDAGDTVRLATAIENTGGGGAFDVTTSVTLPNGMTFVGGSLAGAGLKVYRGDGTLLVLGTDYSVSGNQITFLDAGGVASILPGRSGSTSITDGSNLVIITYDVTVAANIGASRTLESSASLTNYASIDGGTDFTPDDLIDKAGEQVAAPAVKTVYAGGTLDDGDSSATHTHGSDLVVGESMLYDIVVTMPEGSTGNLRIDDFIPAGMRLDTSFNGTGYEIIVTTAGSSALSADFNGTVTFGSLANGTGADGVDPRFIFSASSAAGDNVLGNNSFVIRVRLIASNTTANQAGTVLKDSAQLIYSDPDGDTPNGTTALDRTVADTGSDPSITIREPTLTITQATGPLPPHGVDQDDVVTYTITISNGSAASDFNAYDISFSDTLPLAYDNATLISVTYAGGATHDGSSAANAGFIIDSNGVLRNADGTKIDIPVGGSITLTFSGVVDISNPGTVPAPVITNTASVQWTSLDGADSGERNGADGVLNSGMLNDYRSNATLLVPVSTGIRLSRVGGLADTPAANPTNGVAEQVAVGEVIRYRVASDIAEGTTNDYTVQVVLPKGLEFIDDAPFGSNDGTIRIVFISNGGVTTSITALVTDGTLNIVGNENSPEAASLAADLSNDTQDGTRNGTLNGAQIEVSTDANGNTILLFHLGNLTNNDNDSDLEGVVIEFNARVLNQASNVAGTALGVTATELVGSTAVSNSETLFENVVEPSFTGLDKHIVGFDPNPSGTTGTADVSVDFQQNGDAAAYDVELVDSFSGGSGYTFTGLVFNGTTYTDISTLDSMGIHVSVDTNTGFTVSFDKLNPTDHVTLLYSVTLPNTTTTPDSDATLTWSSLPESFTTWGGSDVGTDGTLEGERTGEGTAPNTYILTEGAGLGIISGKLWDDTGSADGSITPDGPGLAGKTVTLTWAGADGDLSTTGDNKDFTTTTDANGQYHFGVLPAGVFRIDVPKGMITDVTYGDMQVRIDTDTGTDRSATALGNVVVTLGEGTTSAADAGYVQLNDAPVNHLPTPPSVLEDTALAITGLTVSDIDAGSGTLDLVLSVLHGTLSLGSVPAGVTVGGNGTATLTLSGNLADLNTALATLSYQGVLNYNGTDTLTIVSNDRGNTGDANDNGIPSESGDALTDTDTLAITVIAVNDPPTANPDVDDATEAGGTANGTPGVNPTGNLLDNDTDVDIATDTPPDVLSVISAKGVNAAVAPDTTTPTEIKGQYGSLFLTADGSYQYVVDNGNTEVQALRESGDILTDTFDYTIADKAGVTSDSTLTVTIHGANDTPAGVDDTDDATEAGGVQNGTAGSDADGNVLTNDTDVDGGSNDPIDYGETHTVTGVRIGVETTTDPVIPVATGTDSSNGTPIIGTYGTLTIGADGSYTYVLDDNSAATQALMSGETATEVFTYVVTDAGGLNDLAQLTITVHGKNDNPVANDDAGSAQAPSTDGSTPAVDASGNVVIGTTGGDVADSDVDHADIPNTNLVVDGIRTGTEVAGGSFAAVTGSTVLAGSYGTLTINPDGSYNYVVDGSNTDVIALAMGDTLTETFTYQIHDTTGLTDQAQLVITITGANDTPVAVNDTADAVEAGGIANGTTGIDPTGNVLTNDSDADTGDVITVTGIEHDTTSGTLGSALAGDYGSLVINADGSYTYTVDNGNTAVQALRTDTDTLTETFAYTITDTAGAMATATLTVTIHGRNDTPVAVDDTASAVEAGGIANGTTGTNPTGNVLSNDSDVDGGSGDPTDYGETTTVTGIKHDTTAGTVGSGSLAGDYGSLVINADGSYTYTVDNNNPAVQALRTDSQTLTETFTYTISDTAGATATATLTVTIHGRNDAPIGVDDTGDATEAGGVLNGTAGSDGDGNVLTNDTDVDSTANGETRSVTGVRSGLETSGDPIASVAASTDSSNGTQIVGIYGTLTIGANGSYQYVLDDNSAAVQALMSGETATEIFTYVVTDASGLNDLAQLTITVHGKDDNPVANNDAAVAQAASNDGDTAEVNPSGNVITGTGTGDVADSDVDHADIPNTNLVLDGIRKGTEVAGGSFTAVSGSTPLIGNYGTLTINPDGSYTYDVDSTNATVMALAAGATISETFTYQIHDTTGLTDRAQLVITITGANDAPVPNRGTSVASAVEAGGIANGTAGTDPIGNVLNDFTDPDTGDTLTVIGVRHGTQTGTVGSALAGNYGSLKLNADGTYKYTVDNSNAAVQALRIDSQTLTETFIYTINDKAGATVMSSLTVTIHGRDDTPVAVNDTASAVEAGGVANGTAGTNPGGNVLSNDRDVDGGNGDPIDYGETAKVTGIAHGTTTGTVGSGSLAGNYGSVVIDANGNYTYTVNNNNAAVQALRTNSQTLTETFTYTISDTAGATAKATLTVTIHGRNDTPVAVNDAASAVEAGGIANGTAGSNPTGNVLANDHDVDSTANGETTTVTGIKHGSTTGTVGSALNGDYGSLKLNANGSYSYIVDNDNAAVQALRTIGQTLTETFNYTITDQAGATASATLTVTIRGRNDNPIAVDDAPSAVEAGGTANGTPGIDPIGNVLSNDTDVDSVANGETKTVTTVRTGTEADGSGTNGSLGSELRGTYGWLTLNADGSYSYRVDNDNATVQALRTSLQTLTDSFSYTMVDMAGAGDRATVTVTIHGADDAPVATNDLAYAVAANAGGTGRDPSGNVLTNDSDVDNGDSLTLTGIRAGAEAAGGSFNGVAAGTDNASGTVIVGAYGTLTIGADGSYTYRVDSANAVLQALGPLQFVTEQFTYQIDDRAGLHDAAQLSIFVRGLNAAPVPANDGAVAVEAGGLDNATSGVDPRGNVLDNDTDSEGDALTITAIRTGTTNGGGTTGTLGSVLHGQYGDLTMNADGSWSYVLDNDLPAVQALRISGQTLADAFTYTVTDFWGASNDAQLVVTIDGRNDTPIAHDDNTIAVEAGGVDNGTPGVDPRGNVLDNDTDVDSITNGETKLVLTVSNMDGDSAAAGQILMGRYGQLVINPDGSYTYAVDNDNPTVQALRTAGETLTEAFTYRMRDTTGAESSARLTIVLQGANDNPVAVDDRGEASDQTPAPQTSGNVLPNDSDIDGGDAFQVSAIRSGAENASGTAGSLDQPVAGQYGTLIIHADGSYTYDIDLSNPEVLRAAGMGPILHDAFTYTIADRAGATDQAELVIELNISAPYVPPPDHGVGPHWLRDAGEPYYYGGLPDVQPAVFIGPLIERQNIVNELNRGNYDGSRIEFLLDAATRTSALANGYSDGLGQVLGDVQGGDRLGNVGGQFVASSVHQSQLDREISMAQLLTRHGRLSLSADGLLSDPSVFAIGQDALTMPASPPHGAHERPVTATGFREQLRVASSNRSPFSN